MTKKIIHDQMISSAVVAWVIILLGTAFMQVLYLGCVDAEVQDPLAADVAGNCELHSLWKAAQSLVGPDWRLQLRRMVPNRFSWTVCAVWFVSQVALYALLPARVVWGAPQKDGRRLQYGINGLANFLATMGLLAAGYHYGWLASPARFYRNALRILTTFQLVAAAVCLGLLVRAHAGHRRRQAHASPSKWLDFFLGVEINPRFGSERWWWTDVKYFLENHVLIGWSCVNVLLLLHQRALYGRVGVSMGLTVGLELAYVFHHFVHETRLLYMLDFTTEHLGWMLGWGNMILVMFGFPAAALQLVHRPDAAPYAVLGSPTLGVLAVVALAAAGLYVFSTANHQKFVFRIRPNHAIWGDRPPRTLATKRGTKLLLSGWWGVLRHANYTGDMLLALAFGLAAGPSAGFGAYFYAIYLWSLLFHRESRDNAYCEARYGADWAEYCRLVPYRLFPYIY